MAEGEDVINDHVAFRTFDSEEINIERLARLFKAYGYEARGEYFFPDKQLHARHYEHPSDPSAPRVFISELVTEKFSNFLKEQVRLCLKGIPEDILDSDELLFSGNPWGIPSFEVYNGLRTESEYAAWFYVFGFRANHFTVSVNGLRNFRNLEQVNSFLKNHHFLLNASGGEIKGTPAEMLEQSSTMADIVPIHFLEGVYQIPACYYEFAYRYPDSQGKLFSGFIATSADKIFESTHFYTK